jgi:hypothetical protein
MRCGPRSTNVSTGRTQGVDPMNDVEAIVLMIACMALMFGVILGFERL